MATKKNTTTQQQAIDDLLNRVQWLEEERRKNTRKISEMEQRVTIQERELKGREQRILELERLQAGTVAQLSRVPKIDSQLAQFKDDIVKMIEQYDARRLQSEADLDRLRRVEHEGTMRDLADLRQEIGGLGEIRTALSLREAEDNRLSKMLSSQRGEINTVKSQVEDFQNSVTFLEEKEKYNNRTIAEAQSSIHELTRKIEQLQTRLDALSTSVVRFETRINEVADEQSVIEESTKKWMEQVQIGEYERNQKLEKWRRLIEEQQDTIDRFAADWIKISDYYKQAQMAVQTLSQWQEQIEKQQREAAELLRVESHRMQSRWDDFVLQNNKLLQNYQIDSEQRWSTANRHESEVREQITLLQEKLIKLEQEKDLLWRVQSAQADALKQFPRIWVEQVEKAIEQNPNRRRQPALVPVSEE